MKRFHFALSVVVAFLAMPVQAQPADCRAGISAMEGKDYGLAIGAFSRCLELPLKEEPRAFVLSARAYAYAETMQFILAVQDQREFVALQKPKDAWPLIMLGAWYRELKRYDESLEALRAATAYDEDGPGTGPGMAVSYHTAKTLHLAGRYEEAIEACTKGIPKQPDYGHALYQRALSYEALGNRAQAKRDLFRAFELTPKDGYEPEVAAKLNEYGFKPKVRQE